MEDFDIGNILYFILIIISLVAGLLQQSRKAKKIPKPDPSERKPIDPMDELDDIFGKKKEPEMTASVETASSQQVEEDYFEKMHREINEGSTIDREPTIDDNVIEGQLSTIEESPFYSEEDMEKIDPSKFKEGTSIYDTQAYKDVMGKIQTTAEGIDFDLRRAIIYTEIINKPKALQESRF
jgi:hypothetical protein